MSSGSISAGLRLRELLMDLEYLLRDMGLWSEQRPSAWAFASELPFAHDRMSFSGWLQFVFIPTLENLVATGESWPPDCAVAPMAELYFSEGHATRLVVTLEQIDRLVSHCTDASQQLSTTQTESGD